jgi:predicted component of type VI protein secretion system
MHSDFHHTREANLSEVEARIDAKSHPIGDRSKPAIRLLERMLIDGLACSPVIVAVNQRITLGRSIECTYPIPGDHRISRIHCEVECLADRAIIRDLQSTNGTYLNGHRVLESMLRHGDRIFLGATVLVIRLLEKAVDS